MCGLRGLLMKFDGDDLRWYDDDGPWGERMGLELIPWRRRRRICLRAWGAEKGMLMMVIRWWCWAERDDGEDGWWRCVVLLREGEAWVVDERMGRLRGDEEDGWGCYACGGKRGLMKKKCGGGLCVEVKMKAECCVCVCREERRVIGYIIIWVRF